MEQQPRGFHANKWGVLQHGGELTLLICISTTTHIVMVKAGKHQQWFPLSKLPYHKLFLFGFDGLLEEKDLSLLIRCGEVKCTICPCEENPTLSICQVAHIYTLIRPRRSGKCA